MFYYFNSESFKVKKVVDAYLDSHDVYKVTERIKYDSSIEVRLLSETGMKYIWMDLDNYMIKEMDILVDENLRRCLDNE